MRTRMTNHFLLTLLGLLAWSSSALGATPAVSGIGATSHPGNPAIVAVTIDFGAGFQLISQDLRFQYDGGVVDFSAIGSSVNVEGLVQSWSGYLAQLSSTGLLVENYDTSNLNTGRMGYVLSFVGEMERTGSTTFNLAFDVLPGATLGPSQVTFQGSALGNVAGDEFFFPDSMVSSGLRIDVIPVPEPTQALMLCAGIGLLVLRWKRRVVVAEC